MLVTFRVGLAVRVTLGAFRYGRSSCWDRTSCQEVCLAADWFEMGRVAARAVRTFGRFLRLADARIVAFVMKVHPFGDRADKSFVDHAMDR